MPEILRKIIEEQIVLAAWHITESTEQLNSLISLREEEQSLFDQFVAESRKKQWLAYRILIRRLLEPEDFPIEYDQSGKPFLAGSNFHISVTHTDDLAAVIISNKSKAGIDTEKIKPRVRKVMDKFMNEDEVAALRPGHELEQMTLVWCAKEAIYKYFGERSLDFRENIFVEVPIRCGTEFNARVSFKDEHESMRLFSEMVNDCIMVYLIG
jgi:phosphopantetheinyl transferase